MQVIVYGENYTGAHFRGLEDDSDGVGVKVTLKGDEDKIVDFILENFSYGTEVGVNTIDKLCAGYKSGDIAQFDGCGGVLKIEDKNGEQLFFAKGMVTKKELKKMKWVELGKLEVNGYKEKKTKAGGTMHTAYNVINNLVG